MSIVDNSNVDISNIDSYSTEQQLDFAAEIIQDAGILYLQKKNETNNWKQKIVKLKNQIHDIVFENKESIPEGLYIKLMDAIKD